MKIIEKDHIKIYVYSNDHPPPHCHVIFSDGSEVSVDVPLIEPRYNATISKEIYTLIFDNLERICKEWEKLNQPRKKIIKKKKI
ncbi:MAG: DUF4160 domain-containing protein [Ignavibacteriae bacterium]|nr:DUF4160 domain-containing protein [Ignavibacteriota bacterium]NOG99283.1 DUF4160 domain-containing protein [Ignavibacteriota bacterium]